MYQKKVVLSNIMWKCDILIYQMNKIVMILCTKRKLTSTSLYENVIILCTYKRVIMFNNVW